MSPEAAERARRLSTLLDTRRLPWLDRSIVLDECGSTQDEAHAAAAGRPGLILTSLRQTGGRGRPGKQWDQRANLGLAVTFVLDRSANDPTMIPLRAACAVCLTCEEMTGQPLSQGQCSAPRFGIKWPNDVMVADDARSHHSPRRKLAGVLIETRNGLLLLGIGINVLQREGDWPESIRSKAISLAQVCREAPHPDQVLTHLVEALSGCLFTDRQVILEQFAARDVVTGTRRIIEHDNRRFVGLVEAIDPDGAIQLCLDNGEQITLPTAASTIVPNDATV